MKKILTSLGLLTLTISASAQGIAIYFPEEDTDVSGTVIDISSGENSLHQEFDVANTGDATITLRIERVKIVELEGTEDYLCWGATPETGACYSAGVVSPQNPFITPDPSPLDPGVRGWLSTYHVANDIAGTAQYRYYVIDEDGNRLDSVDVSYSSTVSIAEEEIVEVSVYPNPASNIVNITLENDLNNVGITLYNVLGDAVLNQKLNAGTNTFDVTKLPNGIYFYSIFREGEVLETKKLVVRH